MRANENHEYHILYMDQNNYKDWEYSIPQHHNKHMRMR